MGLHIYQSGDSAAFPQKVSDRAFDTALGTNPKFSSEIIAAQEYILKATLAADPDMTVRVMGHLVDIASKLSRGLSEQEVRSWITSVGGREGEMHHIATITEMFIPQAAGKAAKRRMSSYVRSWRASEGQRASQRRGVTVTKAGDSAPFPEVLPDKALSASLGANPTYRANVARAQSYILKAVRAKDPAMTVRVLGHLVDITAKLSNGLSTQEIRAWVVTVGGSAQEKWHIAALTEIFLPHAAGVAASKRMANYADYWRGQSNYEND